MGTLTQFKNKLGILDSTWNNTFYPEKAPQFLLSEIAKSGFEFKDFVVFVTTCPDEWFGINTKGILIEKNGERTFVPFTEIRKEAFVFDFESKSNSYKSETNELNIFTDDKTYNLVCDKNGAVYQISRLVAFGAKEAKKAR